MKAKGINVIKMWEPLWGTHQPRPVDRDELSAIEQIAYICELAPNEVDTVLDIKGRKILRVKLFKGIESGTLMYDYLFFGPLVFAGKNVSLVEQIEHGVTSKNKDMVKIMDKQQLISTIKSAVKKARTKHSGLSMVS